MLPRHFTLFHAAFTVACLIVLPLPGAAIGIKLLALTLLYHVCFPWIAYRKQDIMWRQLWQFYLPFGIFNIFPDWFLSAHLQTLYYPDTEGVFKIGTIGGYMPFLWFIPMFVVTYIALMAEKKYGQPAALLHLMGIGLVIFGASEHGFKLLGSWHAQNVHFLIGNAAVYVLLAEAVLLLSAFYLFKLIAPHSAGVKALAAFWLMLLYMGSLVFFYFLVEVLMRG
ncbi:MAG TPA: hypothetical protein PK239_04070 [Chitinophagales bacterium]|nr:hypothetical protein [Chitinophagales bacterium]HRK26447.1 hypothetical protein [Chitinophagales bacterium]